MVVHRKALVGVAQRDGEGGAGGGVRCGESRLRQVGTRERLVHQRRAVQVGIRREARRRLVSQTAVEKQLVVGAGERVALRQARGRPVQAVAVHDQRVRFRQVACERVRLAPRVGVVHGQLARLVFVEIGQGFIPMLFQDERALRQVVFHPFGGADGGMRRGVDARVGEGVEGGGAQDGDSRDQRGGAGGGRESAAQARKRRPYVQRRFGGEYGEKRRYRQHVAHELHVERAHDDEVRDDPRQENHVQPRARLSRRQRGDQGERRNADGGDYGERGCRDDHDSGGQRQAERGVNGGGAPPHPANGGVCERRPNQRAERQAETPRRELPNVVKIRRRIYILAREWIIADAPRHFGLLGYVGEEVAEIQYGVWLEYEEGDERRKPADGGVLGGDYYGVENRRAAEARVGGRETEGVDEMRGEVGGEHRRGAHLRGEREREEKPGERRISRAPPTRDAD